MNKKLLLFLIAGFALALAHVQAAVLIQYNFDERLPGNMSYADQSGNGYQINFNRTVAHNADYPFVSSHPGLSGHDFSGRTVYNAATSGGAQNVSSINLNTTKRFTMEGWINLEGYATISGNPSGGTLWNLTSSAGGTSQFALRYTAEGVVQLVWNSQSQSGGTRVRDVEDYVLPLNSWTHLAYVKDALDIKIYINGELMLTYIESGITSRTLPTELSTVTVGSNIYGKFDDFRLSDQALTPEELGFHTPFTAIPEPATVGLFLLLGLTGVVCAKRRRSHS